MNHDLNSSTCKCGSVLIDSLVVIYTYSAYFLSAILE